MSNTDTTTPAPNADLGSIIQAAQAAATQKSIPPYLGGVAENYVAPWQGASNFGNLESGRAVYGPQPTQKTYYGPNSQYYETPAAGPAAPQGVKPQYRQGDEQSVVLGLSPEAVFQMKQQLVDSGLANSGILSSGGFWDSGSANAMQDVLSYANVHGLTWQDSMSQLAAEATTHPKPKDLLPPQILSTKSPIDLRETADTVAQSTIGRKLTAAEQARFVSAWQSADLGAQKQQADVTLAYQQAQQDINNGGAAPDNLPPQETTITQPPTPENAAKAALENTAEGKAKSIADQGDAFMGLLKGIVPGAGG